jgi:hypothetical protein
MQVHRQGGVLLGNRFPKLGGSDTGIRCQLWKDHREVSHNNHSPQLGLHLPAHVGTRQIRRLPIGYHLQHQLLPVGGGKLQLMRGNIRRQVSRIPKISSHAAKQTQTDELLSTVLRSQLTAKKARE